MLYIAIDNSIGGGTGLPGSGGGGGGFTNTYSLDFDGVDDYVSTSSNITGSNITLSGWVNFNGSYSNFSAHFPMSITPSNTNAPNETLGRFYKNGSTLQIAIQCFDSTGANFSTYFVDNTTLVGAGWQHICITYNVTTKHIYAYLNGVAQNWIKVFGSSTPQAFLTAVSSRVYESDLTIGRVKPATSTGTYLGLVDEVSTYDRILTQEEITSIASAPTDLTSLSPVAWYRMGDNGAYKSPQWLIPNNENKDKLSNYSFDFDGVDDYVHLGDNNSDLQPTGAFSLSVWVKFNGLTGVQGIWEATSASGGGNDGYVVWKSSGNKFEFYIRQGTSWKTASATTTVTTGTWYHILCTWNGSSTSKIFVNGTEEGSQSVSSINYSANTSINLGGYRAKSASKPYQMDGNIDEVSIFNNDQSENISTIYNSGTPTTLPSGAVAHYKMGEEATFSTNWTVPDAVGSNDGTSNAMTIEDRVGDAPNSENNALSYNMDEVDRVEDTP